MKELWKTMTPDEKGGAPVGGKNPEVMGIHLVDDNGPLPYIRPPEPREETSVALTTGGSRLPTDSGTGQSESMRNLREGPAGQSHISTSHQSQTVSTSPATTRTGPPPKLPS